MHPEREPLSIAYEAEARPLARLHRRHRRLERGPRAAQGRSPVARAARAVHRATQLEFHRRGLALLVLAAASTRPAASALLLAPQSKRHAHAVGRPRRAAPLLAALLAVAHQPSRLAGVAQLLAQPALPAARPLRAGRRGRAREHALVQRRLASLRHIGDRQHVHQHKLHRRRAAALALGGGCGSRGGVRGRWAGVRPAARG